MTQEECAPERLQIIDDSKALKGNRSEILVQEHASHRPNDLNTLFATLY
jgi:hypothetical protein